MRIRRRRHCYITIVDRPFPDMERLFAGEVRIAQTTQAYLLCPLTGDTLLVSSQELLLLSGLSDRRWYDAQELVGSGRIDAEGLRSLVLRRIVVGDGEESAALREEEERLDSLGWHPAAALFHAQTRWSRLESKPDAERESLVEHLGMHKERYGPPPPHYVARTDACSEAQLPPAPLEGPLGKLFEGRMTARAFLLRRELPLEELARALAWVFGAQGSETLGRGMRFLKKTSPSAGALHPIEAYPLITKVSGLRAGLYHYRVERHTLELLEEMSEEAARRLASELTAGQEYFAEAHALIIHVARFDRAFWKYRSHPKMYKALFLDAAHLSQSLYLLAAERGLGAFFTAAINDADIGARLGLDPLEQAAIALNGLGLLDPGRSGRHFEPR